jgi:hypothetical protein
MPLSRWLLGLLSVTLSGIGSGVVAYVAGATAGQNLAWSVLASVVVFNVLTNVGHYLAHTPLDQIETTAPVARGSDLGMRPPRPRD